MVRPFVLARSPALRLPDVLLAGGADPISEAEDEWAGLSHAHGKGMAEKEEEYEDAELLATVTVVEDFDPDTFIHGSPSAPDPAHAVDTEKPDRQAKVEGKEKASTKAKTKTKTRARSVKYETKEARKTERTKQRARRTEKAERAGGKPTTRTASAGARKGKGSMRHTKR